MNPQDRKSRALELRKRGFSYDEIKKAIPISKSTLSFWLRNLKIGPALQRRLANNRLAAIRDHALKRKQERAQSINEVKISAARDIREISKRELWLMGIILYWSFGLRERINRPAKGVSFSNPDPHLIKLFLVWLMTVGGVTKREIVFDIFINEDRKRYASGAVASWAKITGFPVSSFPRIYFLKNKSKDDIENKKKENAGLLRIRVRASSLLCRQIEGWIHGICRNFSVD